MYIYNTIQYNTLEWYSLSEKEKKKRVVLGLIAVNPEFLLNPPSHKTTLTKTVLSLSLTTSETQKKKKNRPLGFLLSQIYI